MKIHFLTIYPFRHFLSVEWNLVKIKTQSPEIIFGRLCAFLFRKIESLRYYALINIYMCVKLLKKESL